MRLLIPSFRTQIVFLVLFLVIVSALFFRHFFLVSFEEYSANVHRPDMREKLDAMYQDHGGGMGPEERERFREEVESVLSMEWQRDLEADLFKKEIALYSRFIFIFLVIAVAILFFITFNLVSRPLRRLQSGTEELSKGNWRIRVRESKFSPLNDLIASFNKMAGELDANRERLIRAEKESMWREMARVMAHEIKNPLTPIRLALERMESKKSLSAKEFHDLFLESASIIQEEIDNLQSLATEFSQFARLPEANIAPHDLNEQLKEIIIPYEDQADFQMELADNLPPFHMDRLQMKQVFVNIIQNAIQSSGDDCTIRMSTSVIHGQISVEISDRGSGIPPEDLEKIFDPYFSTRKKGTGLGLAIVKRIVEQHQGRVKADSQPGVGTTFAMTFPNRAPSRRYDRDEGKVMP
ncbi:MAG: ATP-binding protein [Candidatus Neomarinimicrobiota bacterium]